MNVADIYCLVYSGECDSGGRSPVLLQRLSRWESEKGCPGLTV